MLRCLYTAATGMEAQQLSMDVTANNLANVNTTAFKSSRADFESLLSDTLRAVQAPDANGGTAPSPLQVGLGVQTVATTMSFSQGQLQNTGNPLDLAIQGQGFFRVQLPNGTYSYTRAGSFQTDANGRVVDSSGNLLDPPITLPAQTQTVTIQSDGTVVATIGNSTSTSTVGQIQLFNFTNPSGLNQAGNNLYTQTDASGQPVEAKPGANGVGSISQGFLETSNVNAVNEMINMITTQRAYEFNSKVITTADQMLQKLTNMR